MEYKILLYSLGTVLIKGSLINPHFAFFCGTNMTFNNNKDGNLQTRLSIIFKGIMGYHSGYVKKHILSFDNLYDALFVFLEHKNDFYNKIETNDIIKAIFK